MVIISIVNMFNLYIIGYSGLHCKILFIARLSGRALFCNDEIPRGNKA